MEQPLVVPLGSVDARSNDLVGGKAANLARLTSRGFRVPAGFCVTTSAFDDFSHLATSRDFILDLERHARSLFVSDSTSKLIVRSSANIEDYSGLGKLDHDFRLDFG